MKHIILLLTLLLSLNIFGQYSEKKPTYPIYQYDSVNKTMLVLISLDQARTIDNDYDLLDLLEKSKTGCDSLVNSYQIVITNLGSVIASQDVKLKDAVILNNKNNEIIDNLREQVKKYIQDGMKCDLLVKNKEDEIGSLNKQILKLKVHEAIGYTGLGLFGAAAVTLLIYSVLHH